MKEIWKDIKGYEGRYQVSNLGKVKSLLKDRCIYQHISSTGHYRVYLKKNGVTKGIEVQVLVYEAFYGDRKVEQGYVVDHKNNNKLDNRACNLQLLLNGDNMRKGRTKISGLPQGVYRASNGNGYTVNINNGKERLYLGCFRSLREAELVVRNAREDIKAGVEVRDGRKRFFVEDGYKICTCCGERKPLSEYYLHSGKPYGKCKECMKEYDRRRKLVK